MSIPAEWYEGEGRTLIVDVTPHPTHERVTYNPNGPTRFQDAPPRPPWFQCPDGTWREESA